MGAEVKSLVPKELSNCDKQNSLVDLGQHLCINIENNTKAKDQKGCKKILGRDNNA